MEDESRDQGTGRRGGLSSSHGRAGGSRGRTQQRYVREGLDNGQESNKKNGDMGSRVDEQTGR